MADSIKKRDLPRLNARWPVTILTQDGEANGETRSFTVEGVFLRCLERLREGEVYHLTIDLPEKPVEVTGQLAWSNLDNFRPEHTIPGMGFCFVKISKEDRDRLGDAIVAHQDKGQA